VSVQHKNLLGVNGSIRARGIAHRRLTEAQRAYLADRATSGKLDLTHLSAEQACRIFKISVACMERHRRKEAA
jgi:hypothetical protein